MYISVHLILGIQSPSTRREWIEIVIDSSSLTINASPSTRREWIEIADGTGLLDGVAQVSLHTEGVD